MDMTCSMPVVDEQCVNISQETESGKLLGRYNDNIKMGH